LNSINIVPSPEQRQRSMNALSPLGGHASLVGVVPLGAVARRPAKREQREAWLTRTTGGSWLGSEKRPVGRKAKVAAPPPG
jgi:hypothetical protein